MGSGKHLMISATGFPGTNQTWRFIQQAWREPLEAMAKLAGNKTILTGMENNAGNIANGYVSYNGEVIPFVGGPPSANVTLIEQVVNANYDVDLDNDSTMDSLPAYKTRFLKFGTEGIETFPFSELTRLKSIKELSSFELPFAVVIDPLYVHTDYNFTLALLQKLNGIESGAEVNVQSDWNMTAPTSDAYIQNKPFGKLQVTYGAMTTAGSFAYVYPPSGFTVSNLWGFIPSIHHIYFAGTVDSNDTLWCDWTAEYSNNRIKVSCQNSEARGNSIVNFFAIWKT